MIELGDLVVFTPCPKNTSTLRQLAGVAAHRKLRQRVSCGVVVDRFVKNEGTTLKIIFPEGSYNMDISQVSTISKWYVGSLNKL
jgi:hypothetical protein